MNMKNFRENEKSRRQFMSAEKYITDFLEHAPTTASIAVNENTLDPDKNIQQGLSGPNEFNVKRENPS
jgi:hypothetical protein